MDHPWRAHPITLAAIVHASAGRETGSGAPMLSYRHGFHAGNFADVLKHVVLVHALRHATRKPKPLYVLDTHAGAGVYDLGSAEAEKTGEHRAGIGRLLQAAPPWPEFVGPYLELVRAANPEGALRAYPGSPALARALLRAGDRLELNELHPTDHATLAQRFARGKRVRVTREDGLVALVARMPPPERRGVVLIDPSYEIKTEHAKVVRALAAAHRRFATGVYLLWYPVIERDRADGLLASLRATGIRAQYRLELGLAADALGRGMTGCGLVVVNPPWTLPEAAAEGLPWLARQLDAKGPVTAEWLVPE
jgi:23S rRNA (adenine2030-N6)-methyltransferase